MRNIIKSIRLEIAMPAREYDGNLEFIPATALLSRVIADNGLTEDIELSALLPWSNDIPETVNTELSKVTVEYIDEEAGNIGVFVFGSADLPVRFTLEENATRKIRCKYTRAVV